MTEKRKVDGEKEIKAVIFDMDGLLFDTERLAARGWKEAGRQFGIQLTDEKIGQIRGRNIASSRTLFRDWYGDTVEYDAVRAVRTAYLNQVVEDEGTPVKPGVQNLLKYLKENGIKRALATSSQREIAERYFRLAQLPMEFDASVCGTEIQNSKPAPDVFLLAAKKMGVRPEHCLVLEDSPNGIHAAAAAGCSVIMVPDMDQPTEEITGLCTAVVQTLNDVVDWLEKNRGVDRAGCV